MHLNNIFYDVKSRKKIKDLTKHKKLLHTLLSKCKYKQLSKLAISSFDIAK